MSQDVQRIVVGVDGSAGADAALAWALAEADVHDATVVAVRAWTHLDEPNDGADDTSDGSTGSVEALAQLRARIDALAPTRPVEARAVYGLATEALLDESRDADLIVVGSRGRGGFAGLLLGSVSEQVIEEADRPVVVVPDGSRPTEYGPVVVGVDGSDVATLALHWAAHEAVQREALLRVVHGWGPPAMTLPPTDRLMAEAEAEAQHLLDEALADRLIGNLVMAYSRLEVEGRLDRKGPAEAVLHAAEGAGLIVVAAHGRGRLRRALLGSTSRQLAHHSPCPVVILRAPRT